MIQDNVITYNGKLSTLLSWRPKNELAFGISVAIISTLLSYQAAAIFIDLFLGIKKRGVARVSDMQLLLLTYDATPLSIFRNLFPVSFAKLLRLGPQPSKPSLAPHGPLNTSSVSRLFLLLLITPVLNIVAVILTLEYDTRLTFRDAEFGGLAIGINPDLTTLNHSDIPGGSSLLQVDTGPNDRALVEFSIWTMNPKVASFVEPLPRIGIFSAAETPLVMGTRNGTIILQVVATYGCCISATIYTPTGSVCDTVMGVIPVSGALKLPKTVLRNQFNDSDARRLAEFGASLLEKQCGQKSSKERKLVQGFGFDHTTLQGNAAILLPCPEAGRDEDEISRFENIAAEILQKVTFVNSSRFELGDVEELIQSIATSGFYEGYDLEFLERRRSYITFLPSILLLAGVVIMRVTIGLVTRNDVLLGIGLVLREALRVPLSDSLLPARNVRVLYKRHQDFVEIENDTALKSTLPSSNDE